MESMQARYDDQSITPSPMRCMQVQDRLIQTGTGCMNTSSPCLMKCMTINNALAAANLPFLEGSALAESLRLCVLRGSGNEVHELIVMTAVVGPGRRRLQRLSYRKQPWPRYSNAG